jgi:hypothetical protein
MILKTYILVKTKSAKVFAECAMTQVEYQHFKQRANMTENLPSRNPGKAPARSRPDPGQIPARSLPEVCRNPAGTTAPRLLQSYPKPGNSFVILITPGD